MAKKRRASSGEASSGNAKGKHTSSTSWTRVLAAAGAVVAAVAAFYVSRGTPAAGSPAARGEPGGGRSTAQLEAELRRLQVGLAAVAGRGDSELFAKIRRMSQLAQEVLTRAATAGSEAERFQILQKGLQSKSEWLAALQDHAVGLRKAEADDLQDEGKVPQVGGAIVALTRANFTEFLVANQRAMVEFYAPWCGHCKKFAPVYEACAEDFDGRVRFAIVNGEEESQLSRIYSVGGYPTLKWMVYGQAFNYDGPRTKEHLSKWVEERLTPPYVDVGSIADVTAALDQGGGEALVCFGQGPKASGHYKAFVVAAEHFRGKLIFTWSSASEGGSLEVHSQVRAPQSCGVAPGGEPNVSACQSAGEVIEWLDEVLSFDPDLQ